MTWNSWSDFFHMGGYAFYIWGSYGVTVVLVAGEIMWLRWQRRQVLEQTRRAVKFGRMQDKSDETSA